MKHDTVRCGHCGDGPFKVDKLVDGPEDDAIIGGFYFCGWCRKHADVPSGQSRDDWLVEQAEDNSALRVFDPQDLWDDPYKRI